MLDDQTYIENLKVKSSQSRWLIDCLKSWLLLYDERDVW